jgi:hypothetical protein
MTRVVAAEAECDLRAAREHVQKLEIARLHRRLRLRCPRTLKKHKSRKEMWCVVEPDRMHQHVLQTHHE